MTADGIPVRDRLCLSPTSRLETSEGRALETHSTRPIPIPDHFASTALGVVGSQASIRCFADIGRQFPLVSSDHGAFFPSSYFFQICPLAAGRPSPIEPPSAPPIFSSQSQAAPGREKYTIIWRYEYRLTGLLSRVITSNSTAPAHVAPALVNAITRIVG